MILVLAEIEADAASIDAMRAAITKMEAASLAEPGCHTYCFAQEISNPNRLRIVERWASMEDLKTHFSLPHMAEFQAAMAQNPPKSMDVKVHELGEDLGLPT